MIPSHLPSLARRLGWLPCVLALSAVGIAQSNPGPQTIVLGPAPTPSNPTPIPYPSAGMEFYGFSGSGSRVLCRSQNGLGDIGWFDAATVSANGQLSVSVMALASVATTVKSVVWERTSGVPTTAYVAYNSSFGSQPEMRSLSTNGPGFTTLVGGQLSTVTSDVFLLDACATGNSQFFVRREVSPMTQPPTFELRRKVLGVLGTANMFQGLVNGKAVSSPNDQLVAFPFQDANPQLVNAIGFLSSAATNASTSGMNKIRLQPGEKVLDLDWVTDRYLVGVLTSAGSLGRLVLVDSLVSASPRLIDVTLPSSSSAQPVVGGVRVSPNREWLTFRSFQSVSGTPESSVAVMRCQDVLTGTTSGTTVFPRLPGGGFVQLTPLQNWDQLGQLCVQADATAGARVVFRGQRPNGTVGLHRDTLLGEFTVAGRANTNAAALAANQSYALVFRGEPLPNHGLCGMVVSLFRRSSVGPAGELIGTMNPTAPETYTLFLAGSTAGVVQQVPLAATTSALGLSFYYQPAWFNTLSQTYKVGRVMELPLFF